jgi:hypothetical protein
MQWVGRRRKAALLAGAIVLAGTGFYLSRADTRRWDEAAWVVWGFCSGWHLCIGLYLALHFRAHPPESASDADAPDTFTWDCPCGYRMIEQSALCLLLGMASAIAMGLGMVLGEVVSGWLSNSDSLPDIVDMVQGLFLVGIGFGVVAIAAFLAACIHPVFLVLPIIGLLLWFAPIVVWPHTGGGELQPAFVFVWFFTHLLIIAACWPIVLRLYRRGRQRPAIAGRTRRRTGDNQCRPL